MATKKRPEGKAARAPKPPPGRRAAELSPMASIRADLAKVVGRLSVSGRRDASDPLSRQLGLRDDDRIIDGELRVRAAQVLDAVLAALHDGSRERILTALARAEATIREATGTRRPRVPLPGKAALRAITEAVELDVAARLQEDSLATSDSDLAVQVDGSRVMRSAQAILGDGPSDAERLARWAKRISIVRSQSRSWSHEALAHAILLDLAKQNGVKRPSKLKPRR